jgi:hypothetical protein
MKLEGKGEHGTGEKEIMPELMAVAEAGAWLRRRSPALMSDARRAAISAAATSLAGRFIRVGPVRTDPTQI